MNGKTSWISSSNTALWRSNHEGNFWMIGLVDNLGTMYGGIASIFHQGSLCPYNVPNDAWVYANYDSGSWIFADANDVSIECLAGNHSFW